MLEILQGRGRIPGRSENGRKRRHSVCRRSPAVFTCLPLCVLAEASRPSVSVDSPSPMGVVPVSSAPLRRRGELRAACIVPESRQRTVCTAPSYRRKKHVNACKSLSRDLAQSPGLPVVCDRRFRLLDLCRQQTASCTTRWGSIPDSAMYGKIERGL
ncbi:hypothetical protein TGDOM2_217750 [Toxoplasma gondii GAB2-2007-GAL-DOM2]|uniref:Uncharacterized protein n=2 Tax=Toxoplasma gondii TaxID=5811 RepID=A0A086L1Q8_TOXGO|nr:hypothetical protein TGDOM2_217750 [Toxoplasma gondii GAB2-2007-GAL-DOM2]KFG50576.1 hypothetical protein TGFOU_217750 [Toxoplasma gondii FOU]